MRNQRSKRARRSRSTCVCIVALSWENYYILWFELKLQGRDLPRSGERGYSSVVAYGKSHNK